MRKVSFSRNCANVFLYCILESDCAAIPFKSSLVFLTVHVNNCQLFYWLPVQSDIFLLTFQCPVQSAIFPIFSGFWDKWKAFTVNIILLSESHTSTLTFRHFIKIKSGRATSRIANSKIYFQKFLVRL